MANKQTKHIHIVLLLLSLLAQSFAYAYAPCPEQMDMKSSPMMSMQVDHSAMDMTESVSEKTMSGSTSCCDLQQSDCPKSSCATAVLLNNYHILSMHLAPQNHTPLTLLPPEPITLISLYRPPLQS